VDFRGAYQRARRRRSRWNLLLIPAVLLPLVGLWGGAVMLAGLVHAYFHAGQSLRNAHGLGPILATLSPFFAALPLAMWMGNGLVYAIAPARRALDAEAASHPGTAFVDAQAQMRRLAAWLVPAALAGALAGTMLSWG